MSEAEAEAVAVEAAPVIKAKTKIVPTGNLLFDVANEIEHMSKTKALNAADKLSEDIEANHFRLGGLLRMIQKEQWFDGYPSFEAYVLEKFGFAKRKADYLINIYTNLVDKQIPWEKVMNLGWTKLKDLAPILTLENVDEWVAKAGPVTVMELQAMIKAHEGTATGESTAGTSTDTVKIGFKLHKDQAEIVQNALAKAKGELGSEFDNVAISAICAGYLSNASAVASAPVDLAGTMISMGLENVLGLFEKVFPNVNMTVEVAE